MNKKVKYEILEWIKTIFFSLVLVIGITFIVQPTIVNGQSMYPTLENKDYLFVNKLAYKVESPKRGDIIVFNTKLIDPKSNKEKNLVKRVIALPGEHIVIKNNEVYIDGELLNESYINGVYTSGDIDIIVPENHIFTMGDNRPYSGDSRNSEVGTISLDDVVGKVSIRLYPFDKLGAVN
ncbi:signal peptidase I [Romboutsia sp. 1001216sp1]|uniref:signal peptidase I n=1 Tax=unclassified Romboutsia TaxID=2626894 RepID=UPI0018AA02E1|nr:MULTISPECIES: signal peptidase I [unclassified Romboutsia]MDB8792575.1 signal peptidase I [Romboutsia sp. 1001216sp1]MDB8796257.1 signal peptidase I [Romboutsia sp. 1001216sp1]MDB8798251.1 signal peptidase I [Romboutsia sp. 1001216sp1]